jgi:hypothetical protein
MSGFGEAPLKLSGSLVSYGDTAEYAIDPNEVRTGWIEFSLPAAWEDECWIMIDEWLKEKGKQDLTNGAYEK